MMKRLLLLAALAWLQAQAPAAAQQGEADSTDALLNDLEAQTERPVVEGHFNAPQLINLATTETVGKGDLLFAVSHRFGDIGGANGGVKTLFGLDLLNDMLIHLDYGLMDNLMVGIGRSSLSGRFDVQAKWVPLRQRVGGLPFTLAVLGNVAAATDDNSVDANNVERYPTQASRFTYLGQVILSRKFGKLSLAIAPTILHRNYRQINQDENQIFAVAFGGRWALTPRFALTADYFQTLSFYRLNRLGGSRYQAPVSAGFEVVAGGHVFQLYITNSATLPNEFLVTNNANYQLGQMRLGFNIVRVISFKKKREAPGEEAILPFAPAE